MIHTLKEVLPKILTEERQHSCKEERLSSVQSRHCTFRISQLTARKKIYIAGVGAESSAASRETSGMPCLNSIDVWFTLRCAISCRRSRQAALFWSAEFQPRRQILNWGEKFHLRRRSTAEVSTKPKRQISANAPKFNKDEATNLNAKLNGMQSTWKPKLNWLRVMEIV